MVGTLDEKECLNRSRASCLENIRNLNVWGSSLHDISIIQNLINVEVLNLSVNDVITLKDLSYCPRIKEVYLRRNKINDLKEIRFLKNLSNLQILWLADNPCTQDENYKNTVIRNLPNLMKLDSCVITEEDRKTANEQGVLFPKDENLPDYEGLELDKTLTTTVLRHFLCKQKSLVEEKPETQSTVSEELILSKELTKEKLLLEHVSKELTKDKLLQDQIKSIIVDEKRQEPEVQFEIVSNDNEESRQNDTKDILTENVDCTQARKSNTLSAILILLNDLEEKELDAVKLQTERLISHIKSENGTKDLLQD